MRTCIGRNSSQTPALFRFEISKHKSDGDAYWKVHIRWPVCQMQFHSCYPPLDQCLCFLQKGIYLAPKNSTSIYALQHNVRTQPPTARTTEPQRVFSTTSFRSAKISASRPSGSWNSLNFRSPSIFFFVECGKVPKDMSRLTDRTVKSMAMGKVFKHNVRTAHMEWLVNLSIESSNQFFWFLQNGRIYRHCKRRWICASVQHKHSRVSDLVPHIEFISFEILFRYVEWNEWFTARNMELISFDLLIMQTMLFALQKIPGMVCDKKINCFLN